MSPERRDFLKLVAVSSIVPPGLMLMPSPAAAQMPMALVASYAGKYATNLLEFAGKALTDAASDSFKGWLKNKLFSQSPPATTFGERFNPIIQIHMENSTPFVGRSRVDSKVVVVERHASLLHVNDLSGPKTHLNSAEMKELVNEENGNIYSKNGYRLPVTQYERRMPNDKENNYFDQIKNHYQRDDLNLQYVRDYCSCEGVPLVGFGYRYGDGSAQAFMIRNTAWI